MSKCGKIAQACSLALCALFLSQAASAQEASGGRASALVKEKLGKRSAGQAPAARKPGTSVKERSIPAPGDYQFSFDHGGMKRTYRVHVPAGYAGKKPVPLVFAFHGGAGNSGTMANEGHYGLISKSDKEGFVAVFPNGASRFNGRLATWNAGNCCGYARDSGSDDVGFVREIIGRMRAGMNIDTGKIYAIGMSNGGMFSYRLACDLADSFKAIASVAGTDNYGGCVKKKPVSVMHIHAKNDGHVLFGGGAGPDSVGDRAQVTDYVSVPLTVKKWLKRNKCGGAAERVMKKPGVYCDLYSDCDGNARVKLCVTAAGGHSWPGAKEKARKKADTPSSAISATDEIWDFFESLP